MVNERLKSIVEFFDGEHEWPTYFVITDRGTYQYFPGDGEAFIRREACPGGRCLDIPDYCLDQEIREILGDGETAIIVLQGGDRAIFDLDFNPFVSSMRSYPDVGFQTQEESASWQDELEDLKPMEIR